MPTAPGRDLSDILAAAVLEEGALGGLLIGGLELHDLPDQAAAEAALEAAGFVVSLELRHSAVTRHADVVLPVAAPAEKAGRFVTWEGRRRPFDLTLTNTGQLSDGRVLNALADELEVDLGLPTVEAARAELDSLSVASGRLPHQPVSATSTAVAEGELLLASWHELIDAGAMSDGDEHLADTAKPLRAIVSPASAARLGLLAGQSVTVGTARGSLVVPLVLAEEAADGVVWLPANHRDGSVRKTLGAVHGDPVTVTAGGAST